MKLYVTRLTRESLEEADAHRAMEIIAFSINLEHIGDIIDKNLMELASKKIKRRLTFSAELAAFHGEVLDNLKLAFGVFMSGDVKAARQLIAEKTKLRNAELLAAEHHLARLREGRPESIESSSLHLDILRDLKRSHSHICSVAIQCWSGPVNCNPTGSRLQRKEWPDLRSSQAMRAAAYMTWRYMLYGGRYRVIVTVFAARKKEAS